MNWTLLLMGFGLAVLMGAGLTSLFATVRPDWSARRRQLTAASILPGITLAATLLGILFISTREHGDSQSMEDLAIAAVVTIGGGFVLLALLGSLVGALVAGRGRRP